MSSPSSEDGTAHDAHAGTMQAAVLQRRPTVQYEEPETIESAATRVNTGVTPRNTTSRNPSRRSTSRSSMLRQQLQPAKPLRDPPGFWQGLKAVICASWLNLLLVCIPVSWVLNFLPNKNDTLVFVFSFLAIVPLAKLLAFATDELSMRVGQTLAGLLNATLGNAVELIVSIIALIHCELQVVQSSLVGSILSNLLLVLGMCFFAGGMRYSEQGFGVSAVQLNSSLLIISVIAVLLPAAFHFSAGDIIPDSTESREILSVSHGVALILLFVYGCYLVFQLFSHKQLYEDGNDDIFRTTMYVKDPEKEAEKARKKQEKLKLKEEKVATALPGFFSTLNRKGHNLFSTAGSKEQLNPDNVHNEAAHEPTTYEPTDGDLEAARPAQEEDVETPSLSLTLTIVLLVVVTVLVAVTAEWLVDSIDGLTDSGHITKEFVGVILLPIVGNAAEHVTAVTVSVKDKLTLSLGVAVGSSIQIALFVIPFIVTLAWMMGKPLTMLFDPYESVALFFAVLVVNYVTQDGKSNWLEGMILMCLYVILAVTFWYYPGVEITLSATCT